MIFRETTQVSENHLPCRYQVFLWLNIDTFIIG